ncbi:MAG: hypothetical protein A2Z20_04305 [Bdellovibrionales bacterium RBG_16_40_8]|nr:MAG: hypothetical protein A2Z20_04305 [Bdellovibrionales bacterium RBG_16_40_8]
MKFIIFVTLLFSITTLASVLGPSPLAEDIPSEIKDVGVTEHLGSKIDLSLQFTNESGETISLGRYFNSTRPVLMAMVYFECPNLCTFQLNGIKDVLQKMKGKAGDDYEFVAVSMNHKETADLARTKKANYLKALNMPGAENGWHFLVGSEANVNELAMQLGFRFKWNESLKQFAHSAATYVLTPQGVISRYLYGIEFSPEILRLSLVESSNGKIGSFVERATLFCFQFDPTKKKYTLYAYNIMRIGAAFTILVLAIFLVPVWLRQRG